MKPVLQALILADHVYEDKQTEKKIIAGIFNRMFFRKHQVVKEVDRPEETARQVPGGMAVGSSYVYISLTEVQGTIPLVLRYVDLRENLVLLQTLVEVQCDDRLKTVEMVVPLPPLPIVHEGVFALELLYEDELMGSHRLVMEELPLG